LGILVPNLPKFESLDFSDFAYYGTGGPVAEKIFWPKKWVFGNYLDLDPYDLSDIAHSS
jgi:hypothetical protein